MVDAVQMADWLVVDFRVRNSWQRFCLCKVALVKLYPSHMFSLMMIASDDASSSFVYLQPLLPLMSHLLRCGEQSSRTCAPFAGRLREKV